MFFITLIKWRKPPTKEMIAQGDKGLEELKEEGIKITSFWTLGRYDAVAIIEAPTEKDAMKGLLAFQDIIETETMTAIPRDQGVKLL